MLPILVHHHQVPYLNQGFLWTGRLLLHIQDNVPANHKAGDILLRNLFHLMHPHGGPAAYDGNPAAYLLNLLKLMGNEYDCISIVPQVQKLIKQFLGLLGRQHGRGLVQDQDPGPAEQRLKDLYLLLLSNGQVLHPLVRVHVKVIFPAHLFHLLSCKSQVYHDALPGLHAQDDVLRNRQGGYQHEMLVHHSNPHFYCHLRG